MIKGKVKRNFPNMRNLSPNSILSKKISEENNMTNLVPIAVVAAVVMAAIIIVSVRRQLLIKQAIRELKSPFPINMVERSNSAWSA
jgi:hypothetical protein